MKSLKDMQTLKRHLQKSFRKNHGKEMPPAQLNLATKTIAGQLTTVSVDEWINGHVVRRKRSEDYKILPFMIEVDI